MQGITASVWDLLVPPARSESSWEWLCTHGCSDDGQHRFDGEQLPWARGVCDAFDDPAVRRVVLQWAARLGKTLVCLNLGLYVAHQMPQKVLLGGPTEHLLKRLFQDKLLPMAATSLGDRLNATQSSQRYLSFRGGFCRGVWAGSENLLRDFSARYSIANELDGWPVSTAGEGDIYNRFETRTHSFADAKNVVESTPAILGVSQITILREHGTDCRWWVPCPHCDRWQILRAPDFKWDPRRAPKEGGLFFELRAGGEPDPTLAYESARYYCEHCLQPIDEARKREIVSRGDWAPRGCRIEGGDLVGTPIAAGRRVWSSWLDAMVSLDTGISWGKVAEEWAAAHGCLEKQQTYTNLKLGLAFEYLALTTKAEELSKRLCDVTLPRQHVPVEGRLLTCFVDVQNAGVIRPLPFVVLAHGDDERAWLIDWGEMETWQQIVDEVLDHDYPHADKGLPLRPALTLVDSSDGMRTKEVYDWCKAADKGTRRVMPAKGSPFDLGAKRYRLSLIGQSHRARSRAAQSHRGEQLVEIAVDLWETDIQSRIDQRLPGDVGSLTLCAEAASDLGLLEQLLNATCSPYRDRRGNLKVLWVKRREDFPNDFRDCLRGALCAGALEKDRRRGRWPARARAAPPRRMPRLVTERPYLASDR